MSFVVDLVRRLTFACTARSPPQDLQKMSLRLPERRLMQVPGNFSLFVLFFALTSSSSAALYFNPVFGPGSASYIDQEHAPVLMGIQSSLFLVGCIAVPFASDYIERSGDALPTMQLLASLNVVSLLLVMVMLKARSVVALVLYSAIAGLSSQMSSVGVLLVLISTFATADPGRTGIISALGYSALYLTAPLICVPPVLSPIVVDVDGVTSTNFSSLQILLAFVLIAWIFLLCLPREQFRLSNFKAGVGSAKGGLRTTFASVGRGITDCFCNPEYRGLVLASNCLGVFQGVANTCVSFVVYFAEDYTSMTGQEAFFWYAGFGPFALLLSGFMMIPVGFLMDRIGSLPVLYVGGFLGGGLFIAFSILPPAALLCKGIFIAGPLITAIFWVPFISFAVTYLLPNEDTHGRDMGMMGVLGVPVSGLIPVVCGAVLEWFGSTPSDVNLAGRAQYSLKGYQTIYLYAGASLVLMPILLHASLSCVRRRAPGREQPSASNML